MRSKTSRSMKLCASGKSSASAAKLSWPAATSPEHVIASLDSMINAATPPSGHCACAFKTRKSAWPPSKSALIAASHQIRARCKRFAGDINRGPRHPHVLTWFQIRVRGLLGRLPTFPASAYFSSESHQTLELPAPLDRTKRFKTAAKVHSAEEYEARDAAARKDGRSATGKTAFTCFAGRNRRGGRASWDVRRSRRRCQLNR